MKLLIPRLMLFRIVKEQPIKAHNFHKIKVEHLFSYSTFILCLFVSLIEN